MPTILGANSVRDTGYNVDNSIRLDGTDDHFSVTLTQNGTSQRAFTFSCWIKRSKRNTDVPRLLHMGGSGASPNYYISVRFRDDQNGRLSFYTEANGGGFQLNTDALFRDTTGWMHIVVAVNTEATEEIDRQKMYVNGVQITNFSSTTAMSYNDNLGFNDSSDVIYLFRKQQDTDHFPGYAAEVAFIDGQQLAPTSFGEFDEDSPTIWKPKDFKDDVTFGTNGYYLEFKDSSDLGADTSGNGNDLNTSLAGATSQSTDTCTNNHCTLNALNFGSGTLSEGDLKWTASAQGGNLAFGTLAIDMSGSNKFYWETKIDSIGNGIVIGLSPLDLQWNNTSRAGFYGYYSDGNKYIGTSASSYGASFTNNDIIGILAGNGTLTFYKNGSSQGDAFTGLSGYYLPSFAEVGMTASFNFGSPHYSISSSNSDPAGYGNFEYSTNSGYTLNTKNLAEFG